MTGTREPQQDGSIQAMLRDSGLESAAELRSSLEELRALVPERAPAPRADLAELLAAGSAAAADGSAADRFAAAGTAAPASVPAAPDSAESLPAGVTSLAERRGSKRRLAIVGGAVVGAMTLGTGAVAASSEDFRDSVSHSVGIIFQPSGGTAGSAPQPARPSPSDVPAPAPSNAGGAVAPPVVDAPEAPGSTAVPVTPVAPATAPAVGRGGVLPSPPHRPVVPGTPALPGAGEDHDLPAVPALPGVLPTLPVQP